MFIPHNQSGADAVKSKARMRVLAGLFLLGVLCILTSEITPARAQDFIKVYPSIVSVLPQGIRQRGNRQEPEGSGVVVFDGKWVLTAAHVIGSATRVLVRTNDGEIINAQVAGKDRATDVALLKMGKALSPISMGATPKIGSQACAIGNAFGLGLSLTCGIVSGVHKAGLGFNPIEDFVQTDAAVNPGASGGALIDETGRLIGLLSVIFTKKSDANIGVNFAVSATLAFKVAEQLRDYGRVQRQFSGMILQRFPAKGDTGLEAARVVRVRDNSTAASAGVAPGDIIMCAVGRRIRKPADFVSALAGVTLGGTMSLMVLKAGAITPERINSSSRQFVLHASGLCAKLME